MRTLPIIGLVVGLVVLYVGTHSLRRFFRTKHPRPLTIALIVIGLTSAVALFAIGEYHPSPVERYFGVPFFSFAFIKKRGMWLDYLGPLTVPALIANFYVGFTLPFIGFEIWLRLQRRSAPAA